MQKKFFILCCAIISCLLVIGCLQRPTENNQDKQGQNGIIDKKDAVTGDNSIIQSKTGGNN